MFTSLHALAKRGTLSITITAEGDDQLRVNVTPMPFDSKAKSTLPQPLSLVATPAEFDTEFTGALATWQAPKRSLTQQVLDASVPAPAAAGDTEKPAAAKEKGKPGRKPRAETKGDDEVPANVQAAAEAAGAAAVAADQSMAGGAEAELEQGAPIDAPPALDSDAGAPPAQPEPAAAPAPTTAADEEKVDTMTLDLF